MMLQNFKSEVIIESPGRINLIGEHIDYNGGYVLPAAINKKITLYFKKSNSTFCKIRSVNYNSSFNMDLTRMEKSDTEWENYIIGVAHHINLIKPDAVKGFDCIIDSDLPIGAGISSSAALECGFAKGLCELFKIDLTDEQIITLSRDAEHTFVDTQCGIMDQFAVVKGKKDNLILLNCQTLKYDLIQVDFDPYQIVLLNTNVTHKLSNSEYNVRRQECSMALKVINKKYPQYNYLVDVPQRILEEFKNVLQEKIYNRALYVTQENKRTLKAVNALTNGHLLGFGNYLYESHQGLQHLYEVSCPELDFLVDFSKENDGVIGSRMMGGGFGGCTINIIHKEIAMQYIEDISMRYQKEFNLMLKPIIISIGDGVSKKQYGE